MFTTTKNIQESDSEIWEAISNESLRQEQHIELIASENYASPAVMEAQGGKMTNKYAEGYAGKRYYGGCTYVDVAEELAIKRLKKLFLVRILELLQLVELVEKEQIGQSGMIF